LFRQITGRRDARSHLGANHHRALRLQGLQTDDKPVYHQPPFGLDGRQNSWSLVRKATEEEQTRTAST
jgi:hypothetical protein